MIKPLRNYEIKLELVLTSTIHRRRLVSNYVYGKTDQGYDIFHAKNTDIVKLDNEFGHYEIFSDLDNSGTKYFQSATKTITKLEHIGNSISQYVQGNANDAGRRLFGSNQDKSIKNRLLN